MKKIFLMMPLLFATVLTFSQDAKYILTPSGLRDLQDSSKDYLIISVPDKSAKQLYDATINYINETFKNPESVIKGKVDSEYLRFDVYNPYLSNGIIKAPLGKARVTIDTHSTIEVRFKDGKLKYYILKNQMAMNDADHGYNEYPFYLVRSGSNWSGWSQLYVWDNHQQLKNAEIKTDIEDYFNGQVHSLIKYINNKQDF